MQESALPILFFDLIVACILIWLMRNNPVQRALLLFVGFVVSMRVIEILISRYFGLYGGSSILIGLAGASGLLYAVTRGWNPLAGGTLAMPIVTPIAVPNPQLATPIVSSKFCHQCGARNTADDSFCIECGTKLEAA
jgi:zinc-ribbon domain